MTYAPAVVVLPNPPVISPYSPLSIGFDLAGMQSGGAAGSATWPAAKRVLYIPVYLQAPFTAVKMFTLNGATASGNVDIGVYSCSATTNLPVTKLVAMGSTAQSGTNAIQVYDITDTTFQPGNYFLALTMDVSTGTFFRNAFTLGAMVRGFATYQETTGAFGLPTTATPIANASSYLPVFGMTSTTTV